MSVVDYQEKLRTKSCALFLKLRFWIPPCAKPAGREERQRDKDACPPVEETWKRRDRAHETAVSSQTARFAQSRSQAPITKGEHSPILPTPQDPHAPKPSPILPAQSDPCTSSKKGRRGSRQPSPAAQQRNARNPRHGQPALQRLHGMNSLCQAGNPARATVAIPSSPAPQEQLLPTARNPLPPSHTPPLPSPPSHLPTPAQGKRWEP